MMRLPLRLSGVTAIAAGSNHGLALLSNETIMAWGYNAFGQLGNGTTISSDVPVPLISVIGAFDTPAIPRRCAVEGWQAAGPLGFPPQPVCVAGAVGKG
jgi:hypothetical protein